MGHGRSEASNRVEVTAMKAKSLFILCSFSLLLAGCYFPITGRVVDAETNKPIEGAVVLVEWTKTHGIGDRNTELIKMSEVISDNNGSFQLDGLTSPFVDPPNITVYKKNYTAWNNQYIFPIWSRRNDFKWVNNLTVQLNSFKESKLRGDHVLFLHTVTHWGNKILDAYKWEEMERFESK